MAMPGFAEVKPGTFSLTPVIGGYTFDGSQHLETRPAYGIRGGYAFSGNWGAEAVFDYVGTETTGGKGGVDVFRYGLDALYHFMPGQSLVPFIAAGLGGRTIDGPAGSGDGTHGLFNYGVGLKYFLNDAWAVRGDIRHLIILDRVRNDLEYTVGLSYSFGGVKAPPPAVSYPAPPPPPPPPPLPESASAVERATAPRPGKEVVCIVLKVEFDTDKADIKPKYHTEIARVAEFMKKHPEANGVIEGHTDNVGSADYNLRLSARRASSVRSYLIEKFGIAPARLTTKGYGMARPVASNKTKEGRQKNRRIEARFDCIIAR